MLKVSGWKRLKANIGTNKHVKEVIKGSAYTLLAKLGATGLGLVSTLIIARYYGADMVGVIAIITSLMAIFTVFGLMGNNISILRLIPEYQEKYSKAASYNVYKKVVKIVFITSFFSGSVLYCLSSFIAESIFQKEYLGYFFVLTAPFIVSNSINILNTNTLRGLKKIKLFAAMQLLAAFVVLSLLIILTFLFYHKFNPVYIIFMTSFIMAAVLFVAIRRIIKRSLPTQETKVTLTALELSTLSFPMFLTASMNIVVSQADIVMLGIMTNEAQVGIYAITLKLALLTSFILGVVNTMLAPKFSQLFHAGHMDDLKEVAKKSSQFTFWSTFPLVLLYVIGGYYLLLIFGEVFTAGYFALILLAIGQLVNSSAGSVGFLLNMTGHEKLLSKVLILTLCLNIFLNYVLIPIYGISGAAIATSSAMIFMNLILSVAVKQKFGFYMFYIPFLYQLRGRK